MPPTFGGSQHWYPPAYVVSALGLQRKPLGNQSGMNIRRNFRDVLTLLAAALGGKGGHRYHDWVDRAAGR